MSAGDGLRIRGGRALRGEVLLGQDPQVLECLLALAALSSGRSELQGVLDCAQLQSALAAWSALGLRAGWQGESLWLEGVGLAGLSAPSGALDCGRSPRALAQLAAVICAQRFGTRLLARADELAPLDQLVGALRARGAQIAGSGREGERLAAPLAVAPLLPNESLHAIDATLPLADPLAKDALLLSGLFAQGPTTLSEPLVSADHLERMFVALGLPLRRIGSVVALDVQAWDRHLPAPGAQTLPGSAVLAAHLCALVQWLPGSDVTLRSVCLNPTRSGVLDVLRAWGAALSVQPTGDAALREPIADVRVRPAAIRGGVVDAELLVRSGDALPALALLGPVSARGVTLCELSARGEPALSGLRELLLAFGLASTRAPDELRVPRGASARPERVDARDDHALALAACTLALATPGETVVEHAARALQAVYPGFVPAARQLGASIEPV